MRYFILDDDITYCLELQEMLKGVAAEEVSFACDIEHALRHFHTAAANGEIPDIILCDYSLSGGTTGVEFLEALYNEEFDVPAVLLTDFDDHDIIERAAEQFGVVHIAKTGLKSAELIQQISIFAFRRWAEQRRAASQQIRRQAANMLRVGAEIAHEFHHVIDTTKLQFDRLKRAQERGGITSGLLERLSKQLGNILEDGVVLSDLLMKYGGEIQGRELELESTSVAAEVETVAGQPEFAKLTIRVNLEIAEDFAAIDRFIVRRVLSVLFRNILDHARADHGSGDAQEVDVTIGETARRGKKALFIDVQDNGPGIDQEHRDKIFEAGERGGKSIQYSGGGGLGLGLGFAKTLVELHAMDGARGTIHCLDGISGTGARFRISLPQE